MSQNVLLGKLIVGQKLHVDLLNYDAARLLNIPFEACGGKLGFELGFRIILDQHSTANP